MPVEIGPNAALVAGHVGRVPGEPDAQHGQQDRGDDRPRQHLAQRDAPVRDDAVDDEEREEDQEDRHDEPDQPRAVSRPGSPAGSRLAVRLQDAGHEPDPQRRGRQRQAPASPMRSGRSACPARTAVGARARTPGRRRLRARRRSRARPTRRNAMLTRVIVASRLDDAVDRCRRPSPARAAWPPRPSRSTNPRASPSPRKKEKTTTPAP